MKKLLITGGTGFLGTHIFQQLPNGYEAVGVGKDFDLTNRDRTLELVEATCPDIIIHGCGHNGGIEFNRLYPAEILDNNMRMTSNIFNAAHKVGVDKVLSIATSCAYPDLDGIMKEDEFWNGQCNESIRCHGIAKRMLQAYSEMYNKQHGMNCITAAVTNLYGPYDTFNLTRTKVVGAVIRKVVEAKMENKPEIEFWGTGKPLRQFMYAADAAKILIQLATTNKYTDISKPINIGTLEECTIKTLVETVINIVGYEGNVKWLTDKGDGQMRKFMDVGTMMSLFNPQWRAVDSEPDETTIHLLYDGLVNTIHWYMENKEEADKRP